MSRTMLTALAALALGLLLLAGCRGPVEHLAGDYESGQDSGAARLALREGGAGALVVGAQEAPFRWELREDGRVLLHTRQGGLLVARQNAEALELDLPGAGRLVFRRKPK